MTISSGMGTRAAVVRSPPYRTKKEPGRKTARPDPASAGQSRQASRGRTDRTRDPARDRTWPAATERVGRKAVDEGAGGGRLLQSRERTQTQAFWAHAWWLGPAESSMAPPRPAAWKSQGGYPPVALD